jgi:hypothetical protein
MNTKNGEAGMGAVGALMMEKHVSVPGLGKRLVAACANGKRVWYVGEVHPRVRVTMKRNKLKEAWGA